MVAIIQNIVDDIRKIKSTRKELREFGLTVGIIIVIICILALWRGKGLHIYPSASGLALILFGVFFPGILKPLQKVWMAFSVIVGYFMSRAILVVLFFAVVTPMSIVLRLFGKDLLDERIDRSAHSYWKSRDPVRRTKESYENQY